MALPGNGIFVVQGEMTILMTAMRRGARWSSHSHQDEDLDALLKAFQDLKDVLNKIDDLRLLDPNVFLNPFLEVIRSQETTGPVTSLALSAVNKFLSYGLIDPTHSSVPATVENIADAVSHAKFVSTDHSSDGVVLMKILQVLRTLTLAPEGSALRNESLCEIMLSCFRICLESRLSELLRKTAEHYLKDMVQLVFMRLPQFSEDPLAMGNFFRQLKINPGSTEQTRSKKKIRTAMRPKSSAENLQQQKSIEMSTPDNSASSPVASPQDESSPLITKTSSLRANPLATTPITPAGNIVDMQGAISQPVTPLINRLHDVQSPGFSPDKDADGDGGTDKDSMGPGVEINVQSPGTVEQELSSMGSIRRESSGNFEAVMTMSSDGETQDSVISVPDSESGGGASLNSKLDTYSISSTITVASDSNHGGAAGSIVELQDPTSVDKEYVNPHGVRFTPQTQSGVPLIPYGVVCVHELFRFLISLCNPLDKQNTDGMIHLGLSLLTVAFEVGADSIGKYNSLLALVKDELSRNLFSLLNTERLSVFAADLQVSFLLFESLRTHLKFQLEFYLTKLIEIIITDNVKVTYEHKEIALDNILQLWRIPGFVTELYLNYDCAMYCTNLFEDLTKLLAKNAFPVTQGVYHTHLLSLDALLTIIEEIEKHCLSQVSTAAAIAASAELQQQLDELEQAQAAEQLTRESVSSVDGCNSVTGAAAVDASDVSVQSDHTNIEHISSYISRATRQKVSDHVPTRDELMAVKAIKRWLPTGTEHFNHKPKKGIQFLQEHGVLKAELDPQEVVVFLRENPGLDKRMIGEYVSNRSNLAILEAFVKMFDFADTRIDEALRMYLETFRLPGEAPLISLVMEHFADHWHKCNGEPFANADCAFTLAYAIIMLNVDQHNHNVKKQCQPMTPEDFKKNLKKVNGGIDFDQDLLDEIYVAIKSDEIVMPAEHTGLVRENYLWKVLLRRGASKDGTYVHIHNGAFDYDLFSLIWGPTIAALSFVFDKSEDPNIYRRAIKGFERCAYISSHFSMCANLDMLVLTLSKFTSLPSQQKVSGFTVQFGANVKAQLALKTLFDFIHNHGDNIREGWKNIFELILALYNLNLLPKSFAEADDFMEPSGKISLVLETVQSQKQETGILSSLYSYLSSENTLQKTPSPEDQECIDLAKNCIKDCNLEQLITDSKFLHLDSLVDLVKALVELSRGPDLHKSLGFNYNENVAVFFLELLLKVVIQNRDRVMCIWQTVQDHLYTLVIGTSGADYQFLLERSVIGLLRLAIRLMRNEEMSPVILQSLRMLLVLKQTTIFRISRQISYGLYELLKTSAQNIHTDTDWSVIFTLLECVGAGGMPPKPMTVREDSQDAKSEGEAAPLSSEEDLVHERGYTSDSEIGKSPKNCARSQSPIIIPPTSPTLSSSAAAAANNGGWILVGKEGDIHPIMGRATPPGQYSLAMERPLGPHDAYGLVKCCESLAFLVRDVAHITPYNFDNCVHCIRTFVEASLHGSRRTRRQSGGPFRDPSAPTTTARDASRLRRKNQHAARRRPNATAAPTQSSHRRNSPTGSQDEDADSDEEDLPSGYHQISIQLLDLMHTLHTRTAQIFRWWAEEGGEIAQGTSLWAQGWCPLLQGIASLCCDTRRQVRMSAITYLQRALLVHDLQTLNGPEWEQCFHRVLFPLLAQLLLPIGPKDPASTEETRMRAATVLSKVFLHHLTPLLSLPTFTNLWLGILDFMDKYMHADKSDLLYEAIPESLKNMLLVMDSAKVFDGPDGKGQLWIVTWERIATFLPDMKEELFRESQQRIEERVPVMEPPPLDSPQEPKAPPSLLLQATMMQPISSQPSHIQLQPIQQQPTAPVNAASPDSLIYPPHFQQMPAQSVPAAGHTFPILYNTPHITTAAPAEVQPAPVSLYTEYLGNPYNYPGAAVAAAVDNSGYYQTVQNVDGDGNRNTHVEMHAQTQVDVAVNAGGGGNVFRSQNYFSADANTSFLPAASEAADVLYSLDGTAAATPTCNSQFVAPVAGSAQQNLNNAAN